MQSNANGEAQPISNTKLYSINDLTDKRIGVLMGSAHETYATKTYPNATVMQYKSAADVLLAVKTDKVDAALYDAEPLREIFRQDNSLGLLGDSLFSFDVGVGFNKKNNELKDRFNKFLAKIKEDGTYKDMVDRWMIKGEVTMPEIKAQKNKGILVIGISDSGLPFAIVKDNRLVGFDIELVSRFAAAENKDIKFSNMDFGSLISAVSSGKADMIASSIYVTEERKKQIDFSDSYYAMGTRVFALKDRLSDSATKISGSAQKLLISSLEDLKNKRIGVMLGSTHDAFAHKQYPQAEIFQYKGPADVLLGVKSGKVDVGIYNSVSLTEILKIDPELGLIDKPFEFSPVGFGFNKKNIELHSQFNAFFKTIKDNGVYEDMIDRWTKKGITDMPKIDTPNKNGILVAGHVSDGGLPFVTLRNNENVGLNIELAKRFAAYVGKDIRFDDMEFGGLIPALSTGKIDFIAVTLMFTEERKQKINFGEPYYEIGMSAFALKKNIASYSHENQTKNDPTFFTSILNSFQNNIIQEKRYLLILDGLKTTIIISILATIFGTLLGGIICFLRMSKNKLLNIPAKIYISILRGTPVLVILMIIFYVVFASVNINPIIVATIAFGMNCGAYAAEIFRSGIEGIEKGQMEAGIAMGFNKIKTFIYIILPQTIRRILPIYKGEIITLVKMTSIVGYIAVQDLTKASDIIRSRTFDAFFPLIMIAILYFLISLILIHILDYLEKITDPKYKRKARLKS
jgi:polar amino acid transport system substrate-binding protein